MCCFNEERDNGSMNLSLSEILTLISPNGVSPVLTQEQIEVIKAKSEPTLVIAGAGTGKTQTVILRMVWQIVNMGVDPESILALTFTHRAAWELRRRLHVCLYGSKALDVKGVFGNLLTDSNQSQPFISTYHSFAKDILTEWGALSGYDPDLKLITPDISIQIIRDILRNNTGPDLYTSGQQSTFALIDLVLKISSQMQENLLEKEKVERYINNMLAHFNALDQKGALKGGKSAYKTVQSTQRLIPLLRIAHEYSLQKKAYGFMDYGDQIAFAIDIVKNPDISSIISSEYKCIILDEYQDTSASQAIFLSRLFAGKNIMAVGDPKQSIYAFRGASEANMRSFTEDFSAKRNPLNLSVSFRHLGEILNAANSVASKIDKNYINLKQQTAGRTKAKDTQKGFERSTPIGAAQTFYAKDLAHEAAYIAQWINRIRAEIDVPISIAVLVRDNRQKDILQRELEKYNLQFTSKSRHLLANPAVLDLHAFLSCAFCKNPAVYILRLLVGVHFQIGLADIKSLHAIATALKNRRESSEIIELIKQGYTEPELALPDISLMEAIDFINQHSVTEVYDFERGFQKNIRTQHITKDAIKRIKEFAGLLSRIRDFADLNPLNIIKATVNLLNLDLLSHTHPKADNSIYLTRYIDAAKSWARHFDRGIEDFLQWIEVREQYAEENKDEFIDDTADLQILTLHASKGLEWDYVVMPFCCENKFPKYNKYRGWVSELDIPYDLRLNSDQFPSFLWKHISSGQELNKALTKPPESIYRNPPAESHHDPTQYSALCAKKAFDEARRLFYVGITRAKQGLLITCAQNYDTKEHFLPSSFIKDAGIKISDIVEISDIDKLSADEAMINTDNEASAQFNIWPSSKATNDYAKNIHIINRCIRIINRKKLLPQDRADLPYLHFARLLSGQTSNSRKNLQKEQK